MKRESALVGDVVRWAASDELSEVKGWVSESRAR